MATSRITAAIAFGLALVASPSTADVLIGKAKAKSSEKIGSAAPGDPKPYSAKVPAECDTSNCVFNFGKKANKIRTISWFSCAVSTQDGTTLFGTVIINSIDNQEGYFSAVSRAATGATDYTILEYKNPVTVDAGDTLFVYVGTSGSANGGQCNLGGTIQ